jgi:4-amino-4-deoxy-L-arabinose transferase-like glycosyltransferase
MEPVSTSSGRAPRISFALLFAAIATLRIALLLASQHALLGDEATVGLMARHILDRGERPVFAYGATYNGGSALTAYVATIPFRLFGPTETALKLVPLAFSLIGVFAVYLLVRRTRGERQALVATVVYATSVGLMKWSFDARGAYAECQALLPLVFGLLLTRALREGARWRDDLTLGLVCGLGVYLLETAVAAAGVTILFLALRDLPRRRFSGLGAFLASFTVGAAPLLALGRGASSLDPVAALVALPRVPWRLFMLVSNWLPASLTYDNLESVPRLRLAPNGIEYAFLLAAISAAIVSRRDALRGCLQRLAERREPPPLEAVLLAYLGVFALLFALHPLAGDDARPLVFLEPALSILAGLGLYESLKRRTGTLALLVLAAAAASVVDRGVEHTRLFRDCSLNGPLGRSDPRDADAMIAFLDANRARGVMSDDWDLSWRIVFKSGERIAACHNVDGLRHATSEEIAGGLRFGLVLNPDSPRDDAAAHRFANRGIAADRRLVAGKAVYLLGSADRSSDPAWCRDDG